MALRLQPIRVKRVKRVLEAFSQTKSHLHSEQSHSVPVILHLPPLWFSLTYIKRSRSHFPLCMCTAHSQIFVSMCVHSRFFLCVCLQLSPHLPVVYITSRFQSFHIFGTPHESVGPITHPGPCKILAACRVFPWGLEVNTSLEDDLSWVRVENSSLGFYFFFLFDNLM